MGMKQIWASILRLVPFAVSVLNREPMGMKQDEDEDIDANVVSFSAQPRADGDEAFAT